MVLFAALSFITSIIMGFSGLYEFSAALQGMKGNPSNMGPILEALQLLNWPIIILSIAMNVIFGVIVSAFALRKTVLNSEVGKYGLGFGNDEINLLKGSLIIVGIFTALFFVISFLGSFLSALSPILSFVTFVAGMLVLIFASGRTGQYGVYSILNKTAGVKESYAATKEQFWSYVGAYFLCFIIVIIFALIFSAILNPLLHGVFKDSFTAAPLSKEQALGIGTLVHQIIMGFVGGFINLSFICIGAYIYHQTNVGNGQATEI